MDIAKLDLDLIIATDKLTEKFKEILNASDLDETVHNAMYDVLAEVRHALDDFHIAIVECLKNN